MLRFSKASVHFVHDPQDADNVISVTKVTSALRPPQSLCNPPVWCIIGVGYDGYYEKVDRMLAGL